MDNVIRINMSSSPGRYQENNAIMTTDAIRFLDRYKTRIKWKKTGDKSIDLGCAEGSGTSHVLQQYLPSNYETLVGCDLNEKSIQFANENYATHRIRFHVFDIEGDMAEEWRGEFDHVFSFYTLHWIRNQRKAFENIYELLAEDGDCLLVFQARQPIYDMFRALAKFERWSSYLQNVESFVSPYHDSQEPDKIVTDMMEEIGFNNIDVKCKQLVSVYETIEICKNLLITVNPFQVPEELMKDFLADAATVLGEMRLIQRGDSGVDVIKYSYNLLVVYGSKS